jgi:hypothetical protein
METLPWSKLQCSIVLNVCDFKFVLFETKRLGGGGWGRAEHEGLFYCFNTLWCEVFTRRSMLVLCRRNWSPACPLIRYKYQASARTIWLSRPSHPTAWPHLLRNRHSKGVEAKNNPRSAGPDENFITPEKYWIYKLIFFFFACIQYLCLPYIPIVSTQIQNVQKPLGIKPQMKAQLEESLADC